MIRSSRQLYIDDHLDHHGKKGVNMANGTANTDSATVGQMNTAITDAVSGLGNSLHVPVADLAAAKAVVSGERLDKMLMLVETLGLYRFDAESTAASNDNTVIRPSDIGTDATAGRWVKMSSTITDHNNLSNIQGGGAGDYFHLTSAQVSKLNNIEANADVTDIANVGSVIHGATAISGLEDTDTVAVIDTSSGNGLRKINWLNIKSVLKTYFDTLYNKYSHPNHSGDVTSEGDGATTIGANKVTNAKLADVPTATFKGRSSSGTGDPEDLTVAEAQALLGLKDGAYRLRKYRQVPAGVIDGVNKTFTIADNVKPGSEEVWLNGLLQDEGDGFDYTVTYGTPTTLVFANAPQPSPFADRIRTSYDV